mmetsp:Transcript_31977/g.55117  ORF Transcript_31977/g.55117 Transcript_31977/m.55117 type:complete len:91 (-) Transcript_31977:716-988(-)
MIAKAVKLSRPEVGSSKKRTLGLTISSMPMHTLFFSPPDIPLTSADPTKLCSTSLSLRSCRSFSISKSFSFLLKEVLRSAENSRLSLTVK